jgi:hypothetical protein
MPYAILASALPQAKLGTYMGLFNIFIVVPQLLVATVMGSIMKAFFPGEPIWTMAFAAGVMALAAYARLSLEPAGTVSGRLAASVPHLKGMRLYRIKGATRSKVGAALKGRNRVAVRRPDGGLAATTGLQIGGVLDDLYANDAPLGVSFANRVLRRSAFGLRLRVPYA